MSWPILHFWGPIVLGVLGSAIVGLFLLSQKTDLHTLFLGSELDWVSQYRILVVIGCIAVGLLTILIWRGSLQEEGVSVVSSSTVSPI
jgi:hypothetical protein